MTSLHFHLLINHVPVLGSLIGLLILAHGIWYSNVGRIFTAYSVLIVSAVGAVASFISGEGAEDVVEKLPGIQESLIEEHAEFAEFALISFIIVGILSIIGFYLTWKAHSFSTFFARIIAVVAIISFGIVAQTAYLGGKIRHSEIHTQNRHTVSGLHQTPQSLFS